MDAEIERLQAAVRASEAKTWLLIGPSSEQLIPLTQAFVGRTQPHWHVLTADDDAVLHIHVYDGHIWIDAEAIRPCPIDVWRRYLTMLAEGATLDQHLERGCRWIILRGLELLSPEHMGVLADCLGRGGRGWLFLAAAQGYPNYRRLAQRTAWWMADPAVFEDKAPYRLHLPARATMTAFSHIWGQFLKGRASLAELDEGWLQLVARDVSWEQGLSLLLRETLRTAEKEPAMIFLRLLLETERKPRQRDIFTWRWIVHLAQKTFSTTKHEPSCLDSMDPGSCTSNQGDPVLPLGVPVLVDGAESGL